MENYIKTPLTNDSIQPLCERYNIDKILASIFVRRGITAGKDIMYFLENDLRFMHEPFLLPNMEDAVERILQAKDEGEKVLIFGDSDVDGITSTAILYSQLKSMGIDVNWRLPLGDDAYGLSKKAVDDFAAIEGTLIITVDCGISNFAEIDYANQCGIDVIVTDHHNPQPNLPDAILIIDPKLEDSQYPYKDISGAAVAFKLATALRYAQTNLYNFEICILNIEKSLETQEIIIECQKIKNNIRVKTLKEIIKPNITSIYDLKFPYFLQNTIIFAWDSIETKKILNELFGNNIEFNINDLRNKISEEFPALRLKNSKDLINLSILAKYDSGEKTIMNSLFNLYVSYCKKINQKRYPELVKSEQLDLQLVAISSLADVMPMKNENRIFVKNGIDSIKKYGPRQGLAELLIELGEASPNYENFSSTLISWSVSPAINSTGRLGTPDIALKMLLSEDSQERVSLAKKVVELNSKRKNLVQESTYRVHDQAEKSIQEHQNKLCVVIDETILSGLTGSFAAKLLSIYNVPSIIITFTEDICIGSMRSKGKVIATDFLNSFGEDFFINHGGHNYAAGFSFDKSKLQEFLNGLKERLSILPEKIEDIKSIDAEIPPSYLTPDIFKLVDIFEPYGNQNQELLLLTKKAFILNGEQIGQNEPLSLKLNFDFGAIKVPGIIWNQGNRLHKDILINNHYDIIYKIKKNYFRGNCTNQLDIENITSSNN